MFAKFISDQINLERSISLKKNLLEIYSGSTLIFSNYFIDLRDGQLYMPVVGRHKDLYYGELQAQAEARVPALMRRAGSIELTGTGPGSLLRVKLGGQPRSYLMNSVRAVTIVASALEELGITEYSIENRVKENELSEFILGRILLIWKGVQEFCSPRRWQKILVRTKDSIKYSLLKFFRVGIYGRR